MGINEQLIEKNQQIFEGGYEIILNETLEKEGLSDSLFTYFKSKFGNDLPENQITALIDQLTSPWMIEFIRLDPAAYLEKVSCPMLAINGKKDLQVPSKENLEIIENISKRNNNSNIEIKEIENLNHLFQECETGLPVEYATIEQTFAPIALKILSDWILQQVK